MSYDLYFMPTGNSLRVILLLEALGVEYNKHLHNPFIGNKLDTNLNPTGKVPAVFDIEHEVSLFESGNILLYLCNKHDKEGKLLPVDNMQERARYLSWLFKIVGEAQTAKQILISSTMAAVTPNDKAVFVTRAGKVFHQYLKSFELQLSKNNNGHLLGDNYNILDIAFTSVIFDFDPALHPVIGGNNNQIMQMYLASKRIVLDTVDLSRYPHIQNFVDGIKANKHIVSTLKADYDMWEK